MNIIESSDYGQDRTYSKRFLTNEEERQDMPLYQKAGVAAVATAGLLALGHRSGAIRKITKYLDTHGRATLQAARETLAEEGDLLKNRTWQRAKDAGKRFEDKRRDLLKKQKEMSKQQNILQSRTFQMEGKLKERSSFVGRVVPNGGGRENYEGVIPFHVEEAIRFDYVMKDLRKENKNWLKDDAEIFEKIERAMSSDGTTGGMNPSIISELSEIKHMLKKEGIIDDKYVKALEKVRQRYRGGFIEANDKVITGIDNQNRTITTNAKKKVEEIMRKANELTAKELQTVTRENGAIKHAIIGHKQATVGDILKLHEEGKHELSIELLAKIEEVKKHNKAFDKAIWDEQLYIDKNGELFDYKTLDDIKRKSLEWYSGTLPGMLMKTGEAIHIRNAREQTSFRVLKKQTIQPVFNGHLNNDAGYGLGEDVLYINGLAVKLFDEGKEFTPLNLKNAIGEYRRFYLSTSRYGTMAKVQRSAAGLMTEDEKVTMFGNKKQRNMFEKIFDLRSHDQESNAMNYISILTKFQNPDWERNKINKFLNQGIDQLSEHYELKGYLNNYTEGFNQRTLMNLIDNAPIRKLGESELSLKGFINQENINLSRNEDIVKLFEFIGENKKSLSNDFKKLYKKYKQNPNEVLLATTPVGENSLIFGGQTRTQTGYDVINQALSHEIIDMMVYKNAGSNKEEIITGLIQQTKNLNEQGKLRPSDIDRFNDMMTSFLYKDHMSSPASIKAKNGKGANAILLGDSVTAKIFQQNLKDLTKRTNPVYDAFSSIRPENKIQDEFMVYNAAFNSHTLEGRIKEFFTNFPDIARQTSLFTGRNNMEDFTALSMIGYYLPYRLQSALGQVGLGFSDDSMATTFDIWKNLFTKRFIPTSLGVSAYQYIDYELNESTGSGISERYENMKAHRRLSDAEDRTEEDIAKAKRKLTIMSGAEQFDLYPDLELPFLGEVSPGRAVAKAITGILSGGMFAPSKEETMSYEEVMYDLQYGTEEIRKGRWWSFGSKTAYIGDKVTEFAPNSFRLAHSDYEYTDTMYGDGENWENHWLPNLKNPLGALGYLVGTANPYWFEEKHYEDRPYMLTGELFNANTPILGDIGNAIIGRLVKPVKQMHQEYWDMNPEEAMDIADEYGVRPNAPVILEVSPGGKKGYYVEATAEDYGATYTEESVGMKNQEELVPLHEIENSAERMTYEDYQNFLTDRGLKSSDRKYRGNYRYAVHSVSENPEEDGSAAVVTDLRSMKRIFIPGRLIKDYNGDYEKAFHAAEEREELKKQNSEIEKQNSYNTAYKTRPFSMTAPEYAYRIEMDKQKLREIVDPRSTEWRLQELGSNWMEPQGVYNWIIGDELLGVDPYKGKMVIQRADAATNQSSAFWEQELGSIGGQISEIGRRFIRRDSGQLDTYNPIRNEMPDWLPAGDYFINFQIGDPYEKIANGEYRLPGAAYEALNELHPDETGDRYGAFDKFKILADVAPWSNEYRFWRDYVVKNEEDPELRKQIQIIKKQVTQRKQKREFHEYIFKYADIEKHDVTIKRFLDEYTFLTEEFGDTPIRLAGIDVRANSNGAVYHYLSEGDKVTVGIDANPDNRKSKDTYGTMKAVVFKNMENINQDLINRGMVKELEGDTSATGVHARFTKKEIRQGKRWETIAHYDSALNTKFLKVRSAVEDYERDQIYGKSWATWKDFAITDYLIPSIDEMRGELGPKGLIEATLSGFFVGAFIGRIPLGGGRPKTALGAFVGAGIGASANMTGQIKYQMTGERYLPERRIIEHDINEYFDFLEYLKNMNLYEKSRMELAHQGFDLDALIYDIENHNRINKEKREALEAEKKRLYLEQPEGWKEQQKEINKELKILKETSGFQMALPPEVAMALHYKDTAESTLYAIDPYGDRMKLAQAFPYKDKQYFNYFVEATPEEQKTLLEILPENQKRIYKALWGYGLEEQKPLDYYIEKYNIPDADWEGWSPEYNLEDMKVKVAQKKGLDLSDFNFWHDDIEASQFVPSINPEEEYLNTGRVSNDEIARNIQAVLEGQGYTSVNVNVMTSNSNTTNITFDYMRDRRSEIEYEFAYNMDHYI